MLAPYGTALTIRRPLSLAGEYQTGITIAAGDVKIQKDGGTTANPTTGAAFTNDLLVVTLSATEMQAKEIVVKWSDQDGPAFDDDSEVIYTVGNASALMPNVNIAMAGATADSGIATVTGIVSGGAIAANVTKVASQTATATSTVDFDTISGLSIESNRMLTTTIATVTSQTQFNLTTGSADVDAYADLYALFIDQSTSAQRDLVPITAYGGSPNYDITLSRQPVFTVATGDTVAIMTIPRLQVVSGGSGANGAF